jgi:hypothetical protein
VDLARPEGASRVGALAFLCSPRGNGGDVRTMFAAYAIAIATCVFAALLVALLWS